MKIGVLAVQGAFAEHIYVFNQLEVEAVPVRLPGELGGVDGLVIPGGESTSIVKLMRDYKLAGEIKGLAGEGLPLLGTCAGMVLLARKAQDSSPGLLKLMDIDVMRNAFGRQKESFEVELEISALGEKTFPGVFIRAPLIETVNGDVEVLARLADGAIVAARQGKLLAAAFHPELTADRRFHEYFLDVVSGLR